MSENKRKCLLLACAVFTLVVSSHTTWATDHSYPGVSTSSPGITCDFGTTTCSNTHGTFTTAQVHLGRTHRTTSSATAPTSTDAQMHSWDTDRTTHQHVTDTTTGDGTERYATDTTEGEVTHFTSFHRATPSTTRMSTSGTTSMHWADTHEYALTHATGGGWTTQSHAFGTLTTADSHTTDTPTAYHRHDGGYVV
jgi:hypothetical protein